LKRLLMAATLAVAIHGFLLATNFSRINKSTLVKPIPRVVALTLAYRPVPKPKPSIKKPVPAPAPAVKKTPAPPKKRYPKPKPQKKRTASPRVAPMPPRPQKRTSFKVMPPINPVQTTEPPSEPQQAEARTEPETDHLAPPLETPVHAIPKSAEKKDVVAAKPVATVAPIPIAKAAKPLYRNNPPPRYPRVAQKKGYQGTVILDVYIDKNGGVGDIKTFKSSGYPILDRAAKRAVKNWLFEPGVKGEDKVAMWVKIPIRFELK